MAIGITQVYHIGAIIGTGAYAHVFDGIDANTGKVVAVKKSRASQRITRPALLHESRILQLLQGHVGIPIVYGYAHLVHFEYIAMEHLGQSLYGVVSGPVAVKTAVQVVLQLLSVLKHVHSHGIVHRDIKPNNILCRRTNLSQVVLIDFGISIHIKPGPPKKDDRYKYSEYVVGTLQFASANAHNAMDLGFRDDLESLSYVAFFLLRGKLPWDMSSPSDTNEVNKHRSWIGAMKEAASGGVIGAGFPSEFRELLEHSRELDYDQMPDYAKLNQQFVQLYEQLGGTDTIREVLDWSPVTASIGTVPLSVSKEDVEGEKNEHSTGKTDDSDGLSDSYGGWDLDIWDGGQRHERDRSLTLPIKEAEVADDCIPVIEELTKPAPNYAPLGQLLTLDAGASLVVSFDPSTRSIVGTVTPAPDGITTAANAPSGRLRIEQRAQVSGISLLKPSTTLTVDAGAFVIPFVPGQDKVTLTPS